MDFSSRKAVSLGGARSRGSSKQEMLDESRRKRAERERATAPMRAALKLTCQARGMLARGAAGRRIRAALLRDASAGVGSCVSLPHRLGWLHRLRPRLTDTELSERVATAVLAAGGAPLRAARCTCGVGPAVWDWLVRGACPPLVDGAARGGEAAARLLALLLTPAAEALPPCCAAAAAAHAGRLLEGQAPRFIARLGLALAASTEEFSGSALQGLAALLRAALRVEPSRNGAEAPAGASAALGAAGAEAGPPPDLMAALVRGLWPGAILARPPPLASGSRAALRVLFTGWGEASRASLVLAVAESLRRWQASGVLASGAQRHDAAALVVEALAVCAAGGGCDWRHAGWTEGSPRLLSPPELAPLARAVAARLASSLASGLTSGCGGDGGSGAGGGSGGAAVSVADAELALVRNGWSLPRAAEELLQPVSSATDSSGAKTVALEPLSTAVSHAAAAATLESGICFDAPEPPSELVALRCGHGFCTDCWGMLLSTALQTGAGCVQARCPQPGCGVAISGELWARCVPAGAATDAWAMVRLRSFVKANALLCWCSAAACATAAALVTDGAADVGCSCGAAFCGLCGEVTQADHGLHSSNPNL